jgi:Copper binding octapeptide repeat
MSTGYILHLLLLSIIYMMWRRVRGMSFEAMLDRSADEHHVVQAFHAQHPHGGTWSQFRQYWTEREARRY